eukprot:augustus_masked-scaffold_2-processed-gene-10.4-mRNA-1 protein AED:1.00 eAED:1.00 QI:0/-1/0/0/-1/1/1/0/1125
MQRNSSQTQTLDATELAEHLANAKLHSEERLFKLKSQIIKLHSELEETNSLNNLLRQKLISEQLRSSSVEPALLNENLTAPPRLEFADEPQKSFSNAESKLNMEEDEAINEQEAADAVSREWNLGNDAFADGNYTACLKHHSMAARFMLSNLERQKLMYDSLQKKVDHMSKENDHLKRKVDVMNLEKEKPSEEEILKMKELKALNLKLATKNEATEAAVKELRDALEAAMFQSNDLEDKITELETILIESSRNKLEGEKLIQRLGMEKAKMEDKLTKMELEKTQLLGKNTQLEAELSRIDVFETKVRDLEEHMKEKEQAVALLEAELEREKEIKHSLKAQASENMRKLTTVEGAVRDQTELVQELRNQSEDFQMRVDESTAHLRHLESQLQERDAEIRRLQSLEPSLKSKENDVKTLQIKLDSLMLQMEKQERISETLALDLEQEKNCSLELKDKLAAAEAIQSNLIQTEEKLNNAILQKNTLKTQVGELYSIVSAAQNSFDILEDKLGDALRENSILKSSLENEQKIADIQRRELQHEKTVSAALQGEITSQQGREKALQLKIEEINHALENETNRVTEKEKDMLQLKSSEVIRFEELSSQFNVVFEKCERASKSHQLLRTQLSNKEKESREQIAELTLKVQSLEKQNANLKLDYAEASRQSREFLVAVEEFESTAANQAHKFTEKISSLNLKIDKLATERSSLKLKILSKDKEIEELRDSLEEKNTFKEDLMKKTSCLKLACEKLTTLSKVLVRLQQERDKAVEDAAQFYGMKEESSEKSSVPERDCDVQEFNLTVHDLDTVEGIQNLINELQAEATGGSDLITTRDPLEKKHLSRKINKGLQAQASLTDHSGHIDEIKDCFNMVEKMLQKSEVITQKLSKPQQVQPIAPVLPRDIQDLQLANNALLSDVASLRKELDARTMLNDVSSVFDPEAESLDEDDESYYSDDEDLDWVEPVPSEDIDKSPESRLVDQEQRENRRLRRTLEQASRLNINLRQKLEERENDGHFPADMVEEEEDLASGLLSPVRPQETQKIGALEKEIKLRDNKIAELEALLVEHNIDKEALLKQLSVLYFKQENEEFGNDVGFVDNAKKLLSNQVAPHVLAVLVGFFASLANSDFEDV